MVGLYRSSAGQTITLLHVAAKCIHIWHHMANLCFESSKPFKTYHAVRNALPRDFPSLSSTSHGMTQVHTFNFFPGVHLGKQHLVPGIQKTCPKSRFRPLPNLATGSCDMKNWVYHSLPSSSSAIPNAGTRATWRRFQFSPSDRGIFASQVATLRRQQPGLACEACSVNKGWSFIIYNLY